MSECWICVIYLSLIVQIYLDVTAVESPRSFMFLQEIIERLSWGFCIFEKIMPQNRA